MSLYEHTIIAKQSHSADQLKSLKTKYSKIIEKNEKIDKNLLRFLTVRVKKFDLDKNYFKQETKSTKNVEEKA